MKPGLNPNARAIIEAALAKPVAAAAVAAEAQLRENLSQTSGGRGVQYASLPNRSSAPGQDPIMQSGRLAGMVGSEKVSETQYRVGMFPKTDDEAKQARALEYGYSPNNLAERAYLQRTATDPQTRKEMLEAAKKAR